MANLMNPNSKMQAVIQPPVDPLLLTLPFSAPPPSCFYN